MIRVVPPYDAARNGKQGFDVSGKAIFRAALGLKCRDKTLRPCIVVDHHRVRPSTVVHPDACSVVRKRARDTALLGPSD